MNNGVRVTDVIFVISTLQVRRLAIYRFTTDTSCTPATPRQSGPIKCKTPRGSYLKEPPGVSLAVTEGFEPSVRGYRTKHFECFTFGRSDTSPLENVTGSPFIYQIPRSKGSAVRTVDTAGPSPSRSHRTTTPATPNHSIYCTIHLNHRAIRGSQSRLRYEGIVCSLKSRN